MIKKVEGYMEQHQMVMENDVIVAGVSGGADSVCLFLILQEYCRKKNAKLAVVHLNHGIRKEAAMDAAYVRELCEEFNIPFYLYERDIESEARQQGIGSEEAGRKARYEAFNEILSSYGGRGKIAVAHTKGDQAETVLFHLFRGSNIAGLCGIAPVRENVIRPLLCVERKEIEDFLNKKGRRFCIDSTNEENTYTRNKIRNVILSYAQKEICEQSIAHIADAAAELSQIRRFVEECAERVEPEVFALKEERIVIKKDALLSQPQIIQKQLMLRALEYMVPGRKDIGAVHIADLLSLCEKESGKQVVLPYGLLSENVFDTMVLRRQSEAEKRKAFDVSLPGRYSLGDGRIAEFIVFSFDNTTEIPRKTYTKWFDYDKIISCLEVRSRRAGDYLMISENGNRKKIKEYFIEEKIPKEDRDRILLLADGSHILWVIGKRISEYYKVTEKTRTILQVTVSKEDIN